MPMTVTELIRADHREMERLFEALQDADVRPLVAPTVVALLAAHSRAEESEVYPVVRRHTTAADDVDHSQKEHVEADQLAARLVSSDGATFDALLKQLVTVVRHHIDEEERSVLAALESIDPQEQERLGSAFLRLRSERLTAGATSLTRDELERQARNEGVTGTSSMTKDELTERV